MEKPNLNPTGKEVIIIYGSINHLNLPSEIEKSFISLIDNNKIETIYLEKEELVRF